MPESDQVYCKQFSSLYFYPLLIVKVRFQFGIQFHVKFRRKRNESIFMYIYYTNELRPLYSSFFSVYYFKFVEIALLKTVGKALRKVFLERQVEGFSQRNISAQGKYCTCLGNLKVSQFKISSHQ